MKLDRKRVYGEHLTSEDIFREYILPEIKNVIYNYVWVDLYAGSGNLILPILDLIPPPQRPSFFEKHIYLFDIQEKMVEKAIKNAVRRGIPRRLAEKNIQVRDTLASYPSFILRQGLPVYHITNPPYLYIGYIVKSPDAQKHMIYFTGPNKEYQDLYQIALANDARYGVPRMAYIIPSNFLYGNSVSNRIRDVIFHEYRITKAYIFEKRIFEHTGTNVALIFFEKKETPHHERQVFPGYKISLDGEHREKTYTLLPSNHYRAGNLFDEFTEKHRAQDPLQVTYYLTIEQVESCPGPHEVRVIDANSYTGKGYKVKTIRVCTELRDKILSNPLFIRTIDTGREDGRAGLYLIRKHYNADGILVTKAKYRTHPIQVFLNPRLTYRDTLLLRDYFNTVLNLLRSYADSEFLTTYKYSDKSRYTRKYLGLTQARLLIQTFPIKQMDKQDRVELQQALRSRSLGRIESILRSIKLRHNPSRND